MRIMIKRLLVVTVLVLALGALVVPVALADGGPHGNFGPTTDGCAGCHRAHTGQGDRLLTAPGGIVAFCTSCHGISGQGASTDVESGVFLDPTDRGDPTSGLGDNVVGRGLKGGGFVTAKMDTDLNGSATETATATSNHTLGQADLVMWGNGSISGTPNPGPTTTVDTALKCSDCHNPHGNGAYRILRKQPTNSGATGDVAVADSATKQYTVADENNTYYGEVYATDTMTDINNWCAQCHTRIHATSTADSGDAIYTYRHLTNGTNVGTHTSGFPGCLSCHVAHGSSAAATGFAGQVEKPGGTSADPIGSALLRIDNRGVCEACHEK